MSVISNLFVWHDVWEKNICFHFLGTENPSQGSCRLNISGSLSTADDNVNVSEGGHTASLSISCLNFKCLNKTRFCAVTHFQATAIQRRSRLFSSLLATFLCVWPSMCCVCCCHWIQSNWGLSRSRTERHTHSEGMCQDWVPLGNARNTAMKTQLTRIVNRIRELNKVSMSRKNSAMH